MKKIIEVGSNSIMVDKIVFWHYFQNDEGENGVEIQTLSGRYFYFTGSTRDKFVEEMLDTYAKEYVVVSSNYIEDFQRAINRKIEDGYVISGNMQVFQDGNGYKFFQAMVR